MKLVTEKYIFQKKRWWPKSGKHILAQFDTDTIIVYQAFKHSIADYAVQHQHFGGKDFSYDRMSWIKTNFLWMMYRCGWASKHNQERVLAVKITLEGFHKILSKAWTAEFEKANRLHKKDMQVRLQWDPDHSPRYGKMDRRAIQLGMKGDILKEYGTKFIVSIEDVTEFVKEQHSILQLNGDDSVVTPLERVYTGVDPNIAKQIELSDFNPEEDLPGSNTPVQHSDQREDNTQDASGVAGT